MNTIIGRREWFSIPELGVGWMKGKVDTGARSSCLHAVNIGEFLKEGERWVSFETIGGVFCESPIVFVKRVKSSTGVPRLRHFIEVNAETPDGQRHDLILSLADRSKMKCPLLLGRRALRGMLVDCGRAFVFGKIVV